MSDKLSTYRISHMDSLGQGVSKEADQITFITKTLPGETVKAKIYSKRKGVQFANLSQIEMASDKRIQPSCPHFQDCPSCHYLHTSYEEELKFKKDSLERMFRKIPHPEVLVTPGTRRDSYRNRIQLHYDVQKKTMGMLDVKNQRIAPIPDCLIPELSIKVKLKELYLDQNWMRLLPANSPLQGHFELYLRDKDVKIAWNERYAQGGFTQVFEEMNQILKAKMNQFYQGDTFQMILDLFGGNGNLSQGFSYSKRLCVDYYPHKLGEEFFHADLFKDDTLLKVTKHLKGQNVSPDFLLIDPPRSGFKELALWISEFKPKKFAYVSCDAHTLVRDLEKLDGYQIRELHLIDFFPSTFHFETMVFLEEKHA